MRNKKRDLEYLKSFTATRKEYNARTKEQRSSWARKYKKQKLKTDSIFRFEMYMRTNIRNGISRFFGERGRKTTKTNELLCCTYDYAYRHITKQLKDGMTEENYGNIWHIDHIIPLSFFDMNDITEQKLAFHWGNLQPLLSSENIQKNDKVPEFTNFKYT